MDYDEKWNQFSERVKQRLDQGAESYGNTNFEMSCGDLLSEIEQEALDLMGWTFLFWVRLQKMREALASVGVASIKALADRTNS